MANQLLMERQSATLTQTVGNATRVQSGLRTAGLSVADVLAQLPRPMGSTSLLVRNGQWSSTSLQWTRADLYEDLRSRVLAGEPTRQRVMADGGEWLAVGVPLAGSTAYFEVFPLTDLDRTYRVLGVALVAAALIVPLIALFLGWWASRAALRPLAGVAAAAAAFARGDLDARMHPGSDPMLVPLASAFNDTAAALQRRVQVDARFAADVSHELRNPLTTMVNAVAILSKHRPALRADAGPVLDLLATELRRFERLVSDLLEISRADAGNADLVLEDLRPAELVAQSVAAERVVVAPDARDVVVRTDKRRLERVVANLVDNADKHGGGLVRVTVERADGGARIRVDDAGPGIAAEEHDRVFDRFARGRGDIRTTSEGVGLGLSLVARHVRVIGGSIEIGKSADGGARFTVWLPEEAPSCGE